MKSLKISVVSFAVILLAFSSCGKYEEGPGFSLRTKKARITGTWKLDKTEVNGKVVENAFSVGGITFEKDGTGEVEAGGIAVKFDWEFTDNKEKVKVTYEVMGDKTEMEMEILRLTNKEFWTTETKGDNTTVTKFKKQ